MRLLRRILLAFALAVSTTMMMPTAAAQAGPDWVEFCYPPYVPGSVPGTMVLNTDCPKVFIGFHDCPPDCIAWLGRWDPEIDPLWQREYFSQWSESFETFRDSHLAQDPKLAEQLRIEAIEGFSYAAQIRAELGGEVQLFEVGWIDTKSGKTFEDESGMLWKIGEHLTAGQQLMIESLEKPELRDEAMAHYDEAFGLFGMK